MADGNHLKLDDQADVADDDPFAELTRIMGFDPRQSVKEANAKAAAEKSDAQAGASAGTGRAPYTPKTQPAADSADAGDDFSIDLEKELMGEFSFDEDFVSSADARYDDEPEASDEAEDAPSALNEQQSDDADFDFDFDDAIAASVASEAKETSRPAVAEAHETVAIASDDLDHGPDADQGLDIDAELDAAMAGIDFAPVADDREIEEPALLADDEVLQSHEADEDDTDNRQDLSDEVQDLSDEVDVHLGTEDLRLDSADLDGSADEESLDDLLPEADEFSLDPADLDFHAEELASDDAEPDQAGGDQQPNAVENDEFDIGLHASDFDLEADGVRSEDEEFDADEFSPANEYEYAISADAAQTDPDLSVDEADLIDDAADYEAESDDRYDDSEPAPREEPVRALSPMDAAAAEYRDRETAPLNLASAFNLEAELNALLGNKTAAKPEAEEPAPVSRSGAELSSRGGNDDLAWELEDLVEAAASAESALGFEAEAEAEEEYATDASYEPAVSRRFGPDSNSAPSFEDRASEAPPATPAVQRPAQASYGSMFSRMPGFSDRHQQRAEASGADYVGGNPAPRTSGKFGEPRDPMREDPLDIINELTAKYSKPLPTNAYELAAAHDAPEVETIEVDDRAVALADDLDLPDVDFDDELPPVSAYDDLDSDFASLLHDMNETDPVPAETANGVAERKFSQSQGAYVANGAASSIRAGAASTIPGVYSDDASAYAADSAALGGSGAPLAGQYGNDDFDYDPDLDDALAVPGMAAAHREAQPKSRGLLIAAIVGGVALVGALGAFALSSGGDGDSDAVAIVKADDGPIKVKPENPGGTTVPNQDSKVYDKVSGEGTTMDPQQETLVTTAEEPVDIAPVDEGIEDDPAVAAKSEDRIEQIVQDAEGKSDAEITAVAPRKVRTMVVRPDGTLVPREETDAASDDIRTDAVASGADAVAAQVAPESTGALPQQSDEAPMATLDEEAAAQPEPEPEVAAAHAGRLRQPHRR